MTLNEFAAKHGIAMTAKRIDARPSMEDFKDADHWRVTLRMGKARLSTGYSMGRGHGGAAPDIAGVLDSLRLDASSGEFVTFEGFADEFGYDADSRKAERIYRACVRMHKRLEAFLGAVAYAELLSGEVEAL